jgi:hypothetical protein
VAEFQRFLRDEQSDQLAAETEGVGRRMVEYLQDSSRDVQEPYFMAGEFLDYLFSKDNQVCSNIVVRGGHTCL